MPYDEERAVGGLHRVDLDGTVTRVLSDLVVANGPAFSPDGTTLYLDDSGRQVTLAFSLDAATGVLSDRRELVRHHRGAGDGLTVDDSGDLWIALYGGSGVHRYDASGRLTGRVEVPASNVSSCCLVDGRLFMTTVAEGVSEPLAGRLFVAEVGASAPAVRSFGGTLPG